MSKPPRLRFVSGWLFPVVVLVIFLVLALRYQLPDLVNQRLVSAVDNDAPPRQGGTTTPARELTPTQAEHDPPPAPVDADASVTDSETKTPPTRPPGTPEDQRKHLNKPPTRPPQIQETDGNKPPTRPPQIQETDGNKPPTRPPQIQETDGNKPPTRPPQIQETDGNKPPTRPPKLGEADDPPVFGAGGTVGGEQDELDPLDPEEEQEERDDARFVAAVGIEQTRPAASKPAARSCFLYDRPPRTGSTTMGRAVKACMLRRGFVQPRGESRYVRAELVERMLALDGTRVGLLSKHIYMSGEDVRRMKAECGRMFYVTSCKPMRDRLWSAAKYQFSDGNGNSTLTEEMKEKARRIVERDTKREPFLEAYPYLGEDEKALGVPEGERLVPDYVVRAERMEDDLGRLLNALGCKGEIESKNVHSAEQEDREFLLSLPLRMGDETFVRLNRLAEQVNADGLKKAAAFR